VKDEMRDNLIARLKSREPIFPGIIGYEDTVVPQIVNAVLSRQNFILLGLRGQAKSRILRALTALLDEQMPYIAGCEIRDNPYLPLCRRCRDLIMEQGDATPLGWMTRDERYVEKLATPDVTVADLIGDLDPIKAARGGHDLASEMTMHYGLLPRANRGIFAVNELPDLAGKIQVALFNIMQEGDVQIKGYPVRLELDLALVFSANPEDYTLRRSRTASAPKFAPIIRKPWKKASPSPPRKPGPSASSAKPSSLNICAKSSNRWPSRHAKTKRSTSAAASASACPFPRWSCPSPTRNAAR
jgi:magnesium chelatase subunit I